MKKTVVLLMALSLFSCSNDNQVTSNSDAKKEVNTEDALYDYRSPYDYLPGGAQAHRFLYKFTNTTSLTLSFDAYFGLGGYDKKNDLVFWGTNIGSSGGNIYYSPNLVLNGNEIGNYVRADKMVLPPHSSNSFGGLGFAVPFVDPSVPISTPGFNFNYPGRVISDMERDIISKSGKLYFIKFKVSDKGDNIVDSGIVRMNAPRGDEFLSDSDRGSWKFTKLNDSFFNEQMYYYSGTSEIVIPFTSQSIYDHKYRIDLGSSVYEVGIQTDRSTVEIYLKQLN